MRNLFEINEDEKNRILGLHEQATKNQYLINEQSVVVDNQSQTLTLNNSLEIEDSRNLVGALELKLNKGVTFVRFSSDRLIAKNTPYQKVGDATGIVKTEGTNDIFYWCATKLFQVKGETEKYIGENFITFVKKSFDQLCESIKVQANPENSVGSKQGITWDIAVKRWPCFANLKDKNIYNDGKYDYVIYQIGGLDYYVYIGDGHVYNPSTKDFTSTYLGKDYPCDPPVVQPKPDPGVTGNQENPNATRIKELQRKVGVKDDGILGKMTLKAIMDKLSQ